MQVDDLGSEVVDIALGGSHSCGRKTDGTLWCWGDNYHGELGNGSHTQSSSSGTVLACGDGICAAAERGGDTCDADCSPVAGDGICDPYLDCTRETLPYCDPDCPDPTAVSLASLCGNWRCDTAAGETQCVCQADCVKPVCGTACGVGEVCTAGVCAAAGICAAKGAPCASRSDCCSGKCTKRGTYR